MKQASEELIQFLASTDAGLLRIADLYTFKLVNDTVLRYTSADFNINHAGHIYSCKNAGIARSEMSWQIGLSVDDVIIELNPGQNDIIDGLKMVEAFRSGTFDGAEIQLDMAFYTEGWHEEPLILEKLFVGNVDVDEVSGSYVKLSVKSLTELLNTNFPANVYQTACQYALYDKGCKVAKGLYSENSVVNAGSTKKELRVYLVRSVGYYQNGVILFQSGRNINIKKSVKFHENGKVVLSTPLQHDPKAGDSFTIYAGCDKTIAMCKNKFKNLDNFSGTPFIPAADRTL